jgi:hypothetical protein
MSRNAGRQLTRDYWSDRILAVEAELYAALAARPQGAKDIEALRKYVAWLQHKRASARGSDR